MRGEVKALRLALAAALVGAGTVLAQSAPTSWKDIPKPPLREFAIPRPTRIVLPNGLVLFLMEDRELPLIEGFAYIRAGSRNEPAAKAGMGAILSGSWRSGGSLVRSGDDLDDFLEARAARVETGLGTASAGVSLSCLKGDFDEVFGVFLEILRQPAFAPDKIEIAKSQVNTGIARRNDDPSQIADREALRLVYGPDSPYSRVPEYATVGAVTREDLLAWQRRYVHPNRILLGIVGDFDARAMEAKLRRALASWSKGPEFTDPDPFLGEPARAGIYFVEKEEVNQSNIRMVHPGTTRRDPDYFALEVVNQIFSGNSASRLYSNIRAKQGLAYAVWGGAYTQYDYPGSFEVGMGTKSQTTAAGIEALSKEVRRMVEEPVTAEELQRAKDSILNSFVFQFDSKEKILRQQMTYEYYGYPADFLDRYRGSVGKVTAADVSRAARKHFHPEQLAVVVVGKSSEFDRPLASLGPVTKLDISIPPAPEKK